MLKLGELQEVVFIGHYDMDQNRGNPRTGWSYVLLIGDLSENIPAPVPINALKLRQTWAAGTNQLRKLRSLLTRCPKPS